MKKWASFYFFKFIISFPILLLFAGYAQSSEEPPYKNQSLNVETRIGDLLSRMDLAEKLDLLSGNMKTGMDTVVNERLGIPAIHWTDGSLGVYGVKSTCFPGTIGIAASFDERLAYRMGEAIGREVLGKGKNMVLGPCVNIHRVPQGGRNFESFSEDPYLASRMTVSDIKGIQSTGVIACAKHFAANNQEWNRKTIDTIVSERALQEIYLPAFKAAVDEAGVWSVMTAYNKVNGQYASESKYLLTDILKNQWGFKGFVVSDWGAVHSTIATANAGLDMEMPVAQYFGNPLPLLSEVLEGNIKMSVIDDKVRRILRAMFATGLFDGRNKGDANAVNCEEHKKLALKIAQESIVLLKNENGVLPLNREKVKSIAVIGPNADVARIGNTGVLPFYSISPLEGIKNKLGDKIEVQFAKGCYFDSFETISSIDPNCLFTLDGRPGLYGEYFDNLNLEGTPVHTRVDAKLDFVWGYYQPAPGVPIRNFSVRWTGKIVPKVTGKYRLVVLSEPGSRLYLNNELMIDNWGKHQVVTKTKDVDFETGREYPIRFEYFENDYYAIVRLGWRKVEKDLISEAVDMAKRCDAVIMVCGLDRIFEGEGHDRPDLNLPGEQDKLIEAVTKANKNTVVVLNNGTPVLMSKWLDKVPAVVEAWYPGQEGGNAIADVLFGDVNPSAKLPVTFPKRWEDSSAYGSFRADPNVVVYKEDIFMGYRHFDKNKIEPLFPFGHGLSYTKFDYSDLKISPEKINADQKVTLSMKIQNSGKVAGAEVVQLYLGNLKSGLDRPVKELKGFKKVFLEAGQSKEVVFEIDRTAMSYYDPAKKQWVAEPGKFEVLLGSSSRDIRLKGGFKLR